MRGKPHKCPATHIANYAALPLAASRDLEPSTTINVSASRRTIQLTSIDMASDSGPPPSALLTPEPRLESAASPVKKLDTSREPTPKPELEYILDPRGDLWLHTRGKDASGLSQAARLRVCSRTLARTSPVFNKMLYGRFAEARDNNQDPDQEWVIELPDDLTSPMRTLLEIMHGDFSRMKRVVGPHKSTIRALYDLIVVADKYDCVALLRPWGASWALCQKIETMTNHDLFRMAWVYYQLGYQLGYEEVVTRLILDFAPSTQGEVDEIPVLPASLYGKSVRFKTSCRIPVNVIR